MTKRTDRDGNSLLTGLVMIDHSEGSHIGTIACKKSGANGFISIAGSGQPDKTT